MAAKACSPGDIATKSFFLGPQSENASWFKDLVVATLDRWFQWRKTQFPQDGPAISQEDQEREEFRAAQRAFKDQVHELLNRFEGEIPKYSPRYAGHMFSEISLPALLGHFIALLHNPNNISGESSRVGVSIEDEAIAHLAKMVNYPANASGHFTSGGTVANFEALVRARGRLADWLAHGAWRRVQGEAPSSSIFTAAHAGWEGFVQDSGCDRFHMLHHNPYIAATNLEDAFGERYRGPIVLIPESKHYSWQKGVSLLGLGREAFWPIPLDDEARLDLVKLARLIKQAEQESRPILMIVSVAGTTELGQFDPVDRVQDLLDELRRQRGIHIWHHVDAAYGGFFAVVDANDEVMANTVMSEALRGMSRADSITLDPHKLGYVPYASGSILVRDKRDYSVHAQLAPYIQYKGSDRGPYTIEGSRPATGAAATWMIAETTGLNPQGYGRILGRTIRIRRQLELKLLASDLPIHIAPGCESNVLCFVLAGQCESIKAVNARSEAIFNSLSPAMAGPFTISKTHLTRASYAAYLDRYTGLWQGAITDQGCDGLTLLRLCLLNPFFDSKEMDVMLSDHLIAELRQLLLKNPIVHRGTYDTHVRT